MKNLTNIVISAIILLCILGLAYALDVSKKNNPSPTVSNSPQTNIAQIPQIKVEATVVSIDYDIHPECENKCPQSEFPQDTAEIKINSIYSINNPAKLPIEGMHEGAIIPVGFGYSAREAVIHYVTGTTTTSGDGPNGTVSHQVPAEVHGPAKYENGVFTFYAESNASPVPADKKLEGLKEGTRFIATISYGFGGVNYIESYEVIK